MIDTIGTGEPEAVRKSQFSTLSLLVHEVNEILEVRRIERPENLMTFRSNFPGLPESLMMLYLEGGDSCRALVLPHGEAEVLREFMDI